MRGYWGLRAFSRSPQELLIRLWELVLSLSWRDEDCCCSAAVEKGVVSHPLVRDSKHPVDVVVGGMEVRRFDSILQVIHLVLCNALESGEGPLLGQGNSRGAHGIEGFHGSTTSLQVKRYWTVHLVSKVVPRERHLADDKRDTPKGSFG